MMFLIALLTLSVLGCSSVSTSTGSQSPDDLRLAIKDNVLGYSKNSRFIKLNEDITLAEMKRVSKSGLKTQIYHGKVIIPGMHPAYVAFMPRHALAQAIDVLDAYNAPPPKQALTWQYNHGLEIHRFGKVVARRRDSWEGLPKAVSCVPGLDALAQGGARETRSGKIKQGVGAAILFSSIAAFAGLFSYGVADSKDWAIYGGLGALPGGALISLPFALSGHKSSLRGKSHIIDTVYTYNEKYPHQPQCGGN